ncbi:MAG TPA: DNA topoisomerase subunit B [Thermotogota bacterium]|nr:type IIA DNA topoisomerase subunit B [Thermotogota bacterium]NLH18595.1 type IIA DNA topoisomerase subunit B [Thermotogaceae bacterium]OQC30651.1 MAG: DNA gyrase subunit B [Thermotogota bacterium ADurb.Bin062]HNW47238.1 DNA topoisomerase subunit B [Thermotogota bacterium]HNY81321.1 DNA topoisomerase subunit B [Thermotogota bacterium]
MSKDYGAKNIQVLKGLEPVRKRPGMYIGSTGKAGLHHLVTEVVDNSIDEAIAGVCKNIEITLFEDGSVEVKDDGRGIPVGIHEEEKKSTLELVMTVLHAGGKFNKESYKFSSGLHGVGVSVVNALSEWLQVWVMQGGKLYTQRYARGVPLDKVQEVGEAEGHGTIVRFKPDPTVFTTTQFEFEVLNNRFMELAFLNPGLTIKLKDLRENEEIKYCFEGGLTEFCAYLSKGYKNLHPKPIYLSGRYNEIEVEIALQYILSDEEIMRTYVNDVNTIEGGTHLTGFRTALTRLVNDYIKKFSLLSNGRQQKTKKVEKKTEEEELVIQGGDIREGLVSILSLSVPEPQFEGQTKSKLGNEEAQEAVAFVVRERLSEYFDMYSDVARLILDRIIQAAKARLAAKKAREMVKRKNALEYSTLPGKLADCSTKERAKSEIFIVEGPSAGGSAKQARDREFQAILPLRGKILNVEKASLEKLLKNETISDIITAIGTGIDDTFDIERSRYGKVFIMTDADVDGAHIRTLLLTLFFRHFRPMIKAGMIYIALSPLFRVAHGKDEYFVYTEEEMREVTNQLREAGKKNISVQRYKGLGEMNPEQLWKTTMDPQKRRMARVSLEDPELANSILMTLMGSDVEDRRRYIQHHALQVTNLDI